MSSDKHVFVSTPSSSSRGFERLSFPVGPLGCNCSLLWDPLSKEALIVDPGDEFQKIQKAVQKHELKIKYILHTHAHFDHVGATRAVHEWTRAPMLLHPADRFLWENVPMQGKFFQMSLEGLPAWNEDLEHERSFKVGAYELKTLYTPGHTPGSCCFVIDHLLFAGDTLFQNSIGRTDLWGGDFQKISVSIKERLYTLDDDTHVICGHGPDTQIGVEKRTNPFVSA